MPSLGDVSRDLASIVQRSGLGVVRVSARAGRPATGIVWSDGLILTASHAVEEDRAIEVASDGASVTATVAGRDPSTDLALLRVDRPVGSPLARAGQADLRVGHLVLAAGRPDRMQVTMGIVSALGGSFRSWRGGEIDGLIRTTAEFLPGFSGGPLLDTEGRMVGINSWHYGRGAHYALPVEAAATAAGELERHGTVRRPYLGVGTQPIQLAAGVAAQAGQPTGLLLVAVDASGPAARAGALQGDIIVAIGGAPTQTLDDLFRAVRGLELGTTQALRLVRAGGIRDVTITAQAHVG